LQACMSFAVIKKGTAYCPSKKKTGTRKISEVPVEMRSKMIRGLLHYLKFNPAIAFTAGLDHIISNRIGLAETLSSQS
jgi:hypothetical protein